VGENIVPPSVSVAKIVDADGAKNPDAPVIDLIERFIGLMGKHRWSVHPILLI
jgi:hypothetical protein